MPITDTLTAVSMTVGRGPTARAIAELAAVGPDDIVVDVGSGPGAAAREAARRGATVVAVDPAPGMLAVARRISALHPVGRVTWAPGSAEALPCADASATVVWALSSAHHWADHAAGVAEIGRVLRPGGRVLVCERLAKAGARGHAAHGFTDEQAGLLAHRMTAAGFGDVRTEVHRFGRRTVVVVSATGARMPRRA
jgi:ubiquinone/menaquinone biosynthesis C-methylase UbiE